MWTAAVRCLRRAPARVSAGAGRGARGGRASGAQQEGGSQREAGRRTHGSRHDQPDDGGTDLAGPLTTETDARAVLLVLDLRCGQGTSHLRGSLPRTGEGVFAMINRARVYLYSRPRSWSEIHATREPAFPLLLRRAAARCRRLAGQRLAQRRPRGRPGRHRPRRGLTRADVCAARASRCAGRSASRALEEAIDELTLDIEAWTAAGDDLRSAVREVIADSYRRHRALVLS